MGTVADISEACRLIDNGGSRTLVWFGGISEAFLNPAFLVPASLNAILLRDVASDWYVGGVAGVTDEFGTSTEEVGRIARSVGNKLILAGQSSGGYAALRAGMQLTPDLVVAFAPQTANRSSPTGVIQPWVSIPSVEEQMMANPPGFPVLLHIARSEVSHASEYQWEDHKQIAQIRTLPNVTVVEHPYERHAVSLDLYAAGRFYRTLLAAVETYVE